jgi:AbiV family abortive infection protein
MTPTKYISTAKEDLKSAMILMKNKQYPQSLFLTNQAIEKLCKHILIKDKIITEEKLKRKVGHNSTKVFDILINYLIENINKTNDTE